jgi:hypothetical protein
LLRSIQSLTFASSSNEESDFAAEPCWERGGGNPGKNFNTYCVMIAKPSHTGLENLHRWLAEISNLSADLRRAEVGFTTA